MMLKDLPPESQKQLVGRAAEDLGKMHRQAFSFFERTRIFALVSNGAGSLLVFAVAFALLAAGKPLWPLIFPVGLFALGSGVAGFISLRSVIAFDNGHRETWNITREMMENRLDVAEFSRQKFEANAPQSRAEFGTELLIATFVTFVLAVLATLGVMIVY